MAVIKTKPPQFKKYNHLIKKPKKGRKMNEQEENGYYEKCINEKAERYNFVVNNVLDVYDRESVENYVAEFERQNKTELQKLWDYCESEQLRLIEIENECGITDFIQGEILVFRKIQYKINKKCSSFQEERDEI